MIPNHILDKLLPVPTQEEVMERLTTQLTSNEYPITNWRPGGVMYTLLMICVRLRMELCQLAQLLLNSVFVSYAGEGWLELNAADYGMSRKAAAKTNGFVTLARTNPYPAVRIVKGHVFKTAVDNNGDELRYIATEDVVFRVGLTSCQVPVEAEQVGSKYNVPQGMITKSLIHIESVESIANGVNWITAEGADLENLESFRSRVLSAWSTLAANPTAGKYQSTCEAIDGVLQVRVDDLHPRGQGTIDLIVTSTAGAASQALLDDVTSAAEAIRGPYDDVLVKSSEVVVQDMSIVLQISSHISDDGLTEQAAQIVAELMAVSAERNLNELYLSDVIYHLRSRMPTIRNVRITVPASDILLGIDKVIVLGELTVTVERL